MGKLYLFLPNQRQTSLYQSNTGLEKKLELYVLTASYVGALALASTGSQGG